MPELTITDTLSSYLASTGHLIRDAFTPTLRLGVTGLARSGKTVFITSLIRNLVSGGRLPFFEAHASGRLLEAHLEPQPDDTVPRFDYETHIRALEQEIPEWPESTRRISELRVTLTYMPESTVRRALGPRRLHLDIVDYPGEWLLDLGMLNQSFAEWSLEALARAKEPSRAKAAGAFLAFLAGLADRGTADAEQAALEGARHFTAYLEAQRAADPMSPIGPGRFLMPGDLAGSPALTFFPLPAELAGEAGKGSLKALLDRRYDSYLREVVRPFFRDHFQKLDRQIVLVDALGALNGGAQAVEELSQALDAVLRAFRPGLPTWISTLIGSRRIDRLLFAATKADHIHHTSHDRLEAILQVLTEKAGVRTAEAGALTRCLAIASLRATRERDVRDGETLLPCIAGVPLPGEVLGGVTFDGKTEAIVFPGDLPKTPRDVLDRGLKPLASFPRFRPPRLMPTSPAGEISQAPHIRLDRALDFLIGDWLT